MFEVVGVVGWEEEEEVREDRGVKVACRGPPTTHYVPRNDPSITIDSEFATSTFPWDSLNLDSYLTERASTMI